MNGKNEVWDKVEEFRSQYGKDLNSLPVDVLTVIEVRMRLTVVPFPHLSQKYSVDAAVQPNLKEIYVDESSYKYLEGAPLWQFNRLRFSLAHELGHIVLHRDKVAGLTFKTLEDFRAWSTRYNGSKFTWEQEANEFAGRLLVPAAKLKADFDKFIAAVETSYPSWWTNEDLRAAFAGQVAGLYGVHKDVIAVRLDREELWPMN